MPKFTAEEVANKQAQRLKSATEEIRKGVSRVTRAPGEAAAAKIDKMRAGWLAAVDSGKVEAGLKRVSLEEWKSKMTDKGIPRIAAGIDAAKGKVTDFYQQLLSFQDSLKSQVDRMPDITLEDSINKSVAWIRGMSQFKRK